MKKVLLLRSVPLSRDSRSSRMVQQYRARGYDVQPMVWTRGKPAEGDRSWSYTGSGGYGRKLKGIVARLKFISFVAIKMIRERHAYEAVHVVDFDTGFIAVPLAQALGKLVIYDGFDNIGAIVGGGVYGRALAGIERLLIRWSDLTILPDPIRLRQYRLKPAPTINFISNIPDQNDMPAVAPARYTNNQMTIAYVGTLEERHRALEWIPLLCDRFPSIQWTVAGMGALAAELERQALHRNNLTFLGQMPYKTAMKVLQDADCHFGCYLLSSPAHEFAAPNKMYEHLALGRPLITNRGTPAGDLVAKFDTGFVFDGTLTGLGAILQYLTPKQCRLKGANARRTWDETFAGRREIELDTYFHALAQATLKSGRQ